MAKAKSLKTLTIAGAAVTPSDQWTFPTKLVKNTRETNVNGSKTTIVTPAEGIASGPIRVPPADVLATIQDTEGWELKAEFYDGSALVMTDCAEVSDGEFSTEGGVIELEIDGVSDFL
jgi:hypothetical protein